jgi:DNA-binding transcriptional ArsR family regulator
MGRLDPEARMTIKALAGRGATRSEIARLLRVTEGAVRHHLRRMTAGVADGRSLQPQGRRARPRRSHTGGRSRARAG